MKKLLTIFTFMLVLVGGSFAQTAKEIIDEMRSKHSIKNVAADAHVNIQNGGKTIEIIKLRQYSSKDKSGHQRTMILFAGPEKYKNTRFLMVEKKDGVTDQRVFLPSLGKSRRIVAESEGNSSFFGTDFTYNDMAFMDRATNLDTYKRLPDENYAGKDCYVIESTPKDEKYVYSKTVSKIEKSTKLLLTADFYNKKGKKSKQIELLNYKNIDGIMTPMDMKMSTFATNTSTVFTMKAIKYGVNIPDQLFTVRYLETGR